MVAVTRAWAKVALSALASVALGCATQAEPGGGDESLPTARAGPFRALGQGEIGNSRSAPYALDDDDTFARDPSIVDADGDPATLEVLGYFAVNAEPAEGEDARPTAAPRAIVRLQGLDGRSFDRAVVRVLEASEPWEGGTVGAPSLLRVGAELWMYYAAAGGIGRARSADGAAFVRDHGPVLGPDAASWEAGHVPASPSVVRLWDGSFRMFYEVSAAGQGSRIGEAWSPDGLVWTRAGTGPVLAPNAEPPSGASEEPYDDAAVGSPGALVASSGDRPVLRVYYGARSRTGAVVIGLAARFETDGPLDRAVSPVFGAGDDLAPREPCVVAFEDFTLLFATQKAGETLAKDYPAVVVGVAPAPITLPPPQPP